METSEEPPGKSFINFGVRKIEEIERKIARKIEETLGLRVGVRLVEPKTIQRSMGKAKRLIDKRKLK